MTQALEIDVDQHRRFEEICRDDRVVFHASQNARTCCYCSLHLLFQIVYDLRRCEWSDIGRLFHRIADAQRLHLVDKLSLKLFVNLRRNDESASPRYTIDRC